MASDTDALQFQANRARDAGCTLEESISHALMGSCTPWEPIYTPEKSSAHFSERIDTVGERIYALGGAADALWKSIYTLGRSADPLWEGDAADTAAATGIEEWICALE